MNCPDLPCYTSWDRLTFNTIRVAWLRELQAALLAVSEPQPRQELLRSSGWNKVFRDPELDEARRSHGLAVTGTYLDGEDADTIIVVMTMDDMDRARAFAASTELASARELAGAIGSPAGVWYGPKPVG